MNKSDLKKLAEDAIPLIKKMFGTPWNLIVQTTSKLTKYLQASHSS